MSLWASPTAFRSFILSWFVARVNASRSPSRFRSIQLIVSIASVQASRNMSVAYLGLNDAPIKGLITVKYVKVW